MLPISVDILHSAVSPPCCYTILHCWRFSGGLPKLPNVLLREKMLSVNSFEFVNVCLLICHRIQDSNLGEWTIKGTMKTKTNRNLYQSLDRPWHWLFETSVSVLEKRVVGGRTRLEILQIFHVGRLSIANAYLQKPLDIHSMSNTLTVSIFDIR